MATDALVNNEMEKSGVNSADPRKDLAMQKRILQQAAKWIMGCSPIFLKIHSTYEEERLIMSPTLATIYGVEEWHS
jgi:hypothetical protein